jgi:hypothetical protein
MSGNSIYVDDGFKESLKFVHDVQPFGPPDYPYNKKIESQKDEVLPIPTAYH